MFRNKTVILLTVLLLAIPACQDDPEYEELSFTETSSPPLGYTTYVGPDHIVIPSGILQAVEAEVEYQGDRYLIGSFVDLASRNENVLGILSMGDKNHFLLIGRQPGQTCVDVTVNGEREECIDVTVE